MFFAQRDIKVKYKQAFLGAAWALVQPLVGALTFTIVFKRLADVDVAGNHYFGFALVGFIGWAYFAGAINAGTTSILGNADLVTKVSFPKIVAPVAAVLPALVDLAVGVAVAIVVSLVQGDLSPPRLLIGLPAGVLMLVLTVLGPVLFCSASIVRYRDAGALVGFALQFLIFFSPVAYPAELVPGHWLTLYYVNPLAGCLAVLRWALVGGPLPQAGHLVVSLATMTILLAVGLVHFRANERDFADII